MKRSVWLSGLLLLAIGAYGQEEYHLRIPPGIIQSAEDELSRAGSCMSPDGPITGDVLTGYPPSINWLNNNGYCYDIPTTKNATWCWTFTAPGTEVTLDCGFAVTVCGAGWAYWFSNFKLYTCAPACTLVGTGLSFTGLTPGTCYTWCFNTNFSGCGAAYGFTMLCPYYIYDGPILPITLSSFTAYSAQNQIFVQWDTESESGAISYNVERASDALNFESIGTVKATGSPATTAHYQFTDASALPGTNYYRLRQINSDGSETISEVISCVLSSEPAIRRYYSLGGSLIEIDDVPAGLYIEETQAGEVILRKLYYKS